MAKVSFSTEAAPVVGGEKPVIDVDSEVLPDERESTPVQVADTAVPVSEPINPPSSQVAVYQSPLGFDDDNIGFEDIILPRVNIVQKVGDLSNVFTPGEIVLDKSLVIYTPPVPEKNIAGTKPLNIVVLGFRKRQFAEKTDGKVRGMLVNSEADVVKHGGTLDYKEWEHSLNTPGAAKLRLFERLATAAILAAEAGKVAAGEARLLAGTQYQGKGQPAAPRWFAVAPQEAGKSGPLWRVDFDDAEKTSWCPCQSAAWSNMGRSTAARSGSRRFPTDDRRYPENIPRILHKRYRPAAW